MNNLESVLINVSFLDKVDLMPIQVVLSLSGALLSMWYLQTGISAAVNEPRLLFCVRRLGVALMASGLLWSVSFAYYRSWQPWPPYLVTLLGINVALLGAILTAHYVRKQEERRFAVLSE